MKVLVFILVAILAASSHAQEDPANPPVDPGEEVGGFFAFIGSKIREAIQPHVDDIRESMDDLKRELEESGGVDGLRAESRAALEAFNKHNGEIQERARNVFSEILDNIEGKIGVASESVRAGLTSLVKVGRSLIRETGQPVERHGDSEREPIVRVASPRRARRSADQVIGQEPRVINENWPELRPYLDKFDTQLGSINSLLQDVRYDLSQINRKMADKQNGRPFWRNENVKDQLAGLDAIFKRPAGIRRSKRDVEHVQDAGTLKQSENIQIEKKESKSVIDVNNRNSLDVKKYIDGYKAHLVSMANLLQDIRYEVSNIRRSTQL